MQAIMKYGSKNRIQQIPNIKWDWILCEYQPILSMKSWQPATLKELNLTSLGLFSIHVAVFENLEILNLENNNISAVLGSGMAQCIKLRMVNLRNNKISQKDTLKEFG